MKLALQGHSFNISAITEYEIFSGATGNQETYWEEFLMKTEVLAFDKTVSKKAVEINRKLKKKRKQIAIPDLFIAATALAFQLPLATLNKKHFERVEGLELLEI